MKIHFLNEPIEDNDLSNIVVGDIVYYTGTLYTARDHVHMRIVKENLESPIDFQKGAIFHAGPIMRKVEGEEDPFEVVSIGPTTSMRMEKLEHLFIEQTGVKLIIGKGGMGKLTSQACGKYKCLHTIFPGGCAVLAASRVKRVKNVYWDDLGMPEAIWEMEVDQFGPLVVSIDALGNNFIEDKKELYKERKEAILSELGSKVGDCF